MAIDMIKMSSKGQIVIPQNIRGEISATEGTIFAVVSAKDSIVLKKISVPSKDELISDLKEIAKQGKKRLESKGVKEADIPDLVYKARKNK